MASSMVVTKLFVVSNSSLDASIVTCQSDGNANHTSYVVGGDWALGKRSDFVVHLCVQRQRVAEITDPTALILQRVYVFEGAIDCPTPWTLLYYPRDRVAVCAKFAPASSVVLSSFNYVSDVDVASERFYADAVAGWSTVPTSVLVGNVQDGGVFLSVRTPIKPVTRLQVIRTTTSDGTVAVNVCEDLLGSAWIQVDNSDSAARIAVCFSRSSADDPDAVSKSVLVNLTVLDTTAPCAGTTLALTEDVSMCAVWASLASGQSTRIADLRLVSTTEPGGTEAIQTASTSGFIKLTATPLSLSKDSTVKTHLFARFVSEPTYTEAPQDTAARAKPPLNATVTNSTLTFRILQLADLHFTGQPDYACRDPPAAMAGTQCTERIMASFIDNLLDLERPDLVVFTGDNIDVGTAEYRSAAVEAFTRSVEARGIPFTLVLGNHDDDGGFPREHILEAAVNRSHCYAQHGPLNVAGVGNYALDIHAPTRGSWGDTGAPVFRLYFLDSHAYTDTADFPQTGSKYAWIQPSQLEYYRSLAAGNAAHTPALMFFHIPLPEYSTTYFATGEGNEASCPSSVNSHLLSTLVDVGDVKATFVGHDHANEYCALRDGIQLCYGGGAGFGLAYGRSTFSRRARVIEWSVDNASHHTIQTWSRFHDDLSAKHHEQILHSDKDGLPRVDVTLTNQHKLMRTPSHVPVIAGSCGSAVGLIGAAMAVAYWWKYKSHGLSKKKTERGPHVQPSQSVTPTAVTLRKA